MGYPVFGTRHCHNRTCGKRINCDEYYCKHCGSRQYQTCSSCKEKFISLSDKFCSTCGHALAPAYPVPVKAARR